MKKHMNKLRESFATKEIIDEGQSLSDYYSPLSTECHTDRFTSCITDSKEIENNRKSAKNEEI